MEDSTPHSDQFPELLLETAQAASRYLQALSERHILPTSEAVQNLSSLGGGFPELSTSPAEILRLLEQIAAPATVANTTGRYFGFVVGGSLPGALAASWLTSAWDQNCGLTLMSPVAAQLEWIALRWVIEALGLPLECGGGLVTGCTMANFSALAAARCALLANAGWDAVSQGLFGAPEIKVVVSAEVHASMQKALSLVGFGRDRVHKVPVDEQGRMRAAALPPLDARTVVCIQAGNVNTGSFDPAAEICEKAREAGAWVHVDGAFIPLYSRDVEASAWN